MPSCFTALITTVGYIDADLLQILDGMINERNSTRKVNKAGHSAQRIITEVDS